ncbi:MAG: GNAT family N-acetyltransferase [Nanoarchaeota archaeon]|nr:GNAT family N-acetyltransferase [Nanoarchaeota archaeon]
MDYYYKEYWDDGHFMHGWVLYKDNGIIAGKCGFEIEKDGQIEIGSGYPSVLSVSEGYHKRGLGKRIMNTTIEYAIECALAEDIHPKEVFGTTRADNEKMISIFLASGFVNGNSQSEILRFTRPVK